MTVSSRSGEARRDMVGGSRPCSRQRNSEDAASSHPYGEPLEPWPPDRGGRAFVQLTCAEAAHRGANAIGRCRFGRHLRPASCGRQGTAEPAACATVRSGPPSARGRRESGAWSLSRASAGNVWHPPSNAVLQKLQLWRTHHSFVGASQLRSARLFSLPDLAMPGAWQPASPFFVGGATRRAGCP